MVRVATSGSRYLLRNSQSLSILRHSISMIWFWALVLPLLFVSYSLCEDTVADDIGPHMITRIAQLLTPLECQHYYLRITGPDRDLAKLLGPPSPNSERKRKRRDIVTIEDCTKTLKNWVETQGNTVYWDRVFSTLYRVGRADVALVNSIKDEDWDLIVQRRKVPPYGRHLNEWCWPMVYGVIFGFLAAPLLGGLTFLIIFVMKLIDNTENYMRIKIK
ncbi:transmembrane and death domain protein 1 isoform X3 [Ranitomeya variabilis]|uniref:transmembrane and death domain protein 1 isoform X3 n=1 Tax=Ranitomeya variabilis TaxID=490064 RepID=UPI004056C290